MKDITRDIGFFIAGVAFAFIFTTLGIKTYIVEPLKATAIEKGYASYKLINPKDPNTAAFVWK